MKWDPLTSAKTNWWLLISEPGNRDHRDSIICVYDGPDYLLLFWRT